MMHRRLRRVALQAERHTKTLPLRMRGQGSTRGRKRIPFGERNGKKKEQVQKARKQGGERIADTVGGKESERAKVDCVSGFSGRRLKDPVKQCHYDLHTFQDFTKKSSMA